MGPREQVAQLHAELSQLTERVQQLQAQRRAQLAAQQQDQTDTAETTQDDAPADSAATDHSQTVSECWEVDFENTTVAQIRRSGDVCGELARLTERVQEVREARQAYLASTAEQQVGDEDAARAEQLTHWHTDDQAATQTDDRATEPPVLDRCSDGDAA